MGLFGLFKPAWMSNTTNFAKAKAISESISGTEIDEKKLYEIAKKAPNTIIRQAALKKLTDVSLLVDLAQNGSHADRRLEAVNILGHKAKSAAQSQALFEYIVKNENNITLREATVRKLDNQTLLADIIKNDSNKQIRFAAVSALNDRTALEDIAKNASDYEIRREAIVKFARIALVQRLNGVFDFISVIKKISDRSILEDIAKNSKNKQERRESEVRLFFLFGVSQNCKKHNWESLDCCLKKCTLCGALEYDHEYKGFNFSDNGFVDSAEFQCKKCGHSAKRREGIVKEQYIDTREDGMIYKR